MFKKLKVVAIATTPEDRAQGLNSPNLQHPLKSDECMFFVFDKPSDSSFWNRGVKYAIDVAYFDKSHKLLSVAQLQPDQQAPVYCLTGHFKYVVETKLNWFNKYQIPSGTKFDDLIEFPPAQQSPDEQVHQSRIQEIYPQEKNINTNRRIK